MEFETRVPGQQSEPQFLILSGSLKEIRDALFEILNIYISQDAVQNRCLGISSLTSTDL